MYPRSRIAAHHDADVVPLAYLRMPMNPDPSPHTTSSDSAVKALFIAQTHRRAVADAASAKPMNDHRCASLVMRLETLFLTSALR